MKICTIFYWKQIFLFCKYTCIACTFAGHVKCIQAPDCCDVNEYCIAWKQYVYVELHIDTLNISESLDGALFYLQALKSCEKATKPVYVSPGHKISIDSATELVHRCSKYRVPEPIRQVNPRPMDSVPVICGVFFSTGFYRIFWLIHFYKSMNVQCQIQN